MWKIVSMKLCEMVAVSEKVLGSKIDVENWCKKLESVKILVWKIGKKNSSQKMKKNWTNGWNLKIGVGVNIRGRRINRKLESEKIF